MQHKFVFIVTLSKITMWHFIIELFIQIFYKLLNISRKIVPEILDLFNNRFKLFKLLESLIFKNVLVQEARRISSRFTKGLSPPVPDSTFGIPIDPGQSFIQIRNPDTPRYPECLMDRLILTHDAHYTRESHELICTFYIVFIHVVLFQREICHFKRRRENSIFINHASTIKQSAPFNQQMNLNNILHKKMYL